MRASTGDLVLRRGRAKPPVPDETNGTVVYRSASSVSGGTGSCCGFEADLVDSSEGGGDYWGGFFLSASGPGLAREDCCSPPVVYGGLGSTRMGDC